VAGTGVIRWPSAVKCVGREAPCPWTLSEFDKGNRAAYAAAMRTPNVRITQVILDILDVLANAQRDDPAWGLRMCEQTGYGTGTVYPALDRLLKAGWIADKWEDPLPPDRPRRRFYEITTTGRERHAAAIRAREERRARWLHPVPRTGGG
jgi:PadR family transcriptional regulator PadR